MEDWPKGCNLFSLPTEIDEEESFVLMAETRETTSDLLDWKRHNQLPRALNVVAFVLRFLKAVLARVSTALRGKIEARTPEVCAMEFQPYITATEKEMAIRVLIRNHQELRLPLAKQNALKQLKLKADEQGFFAAKDD
ncbi:unnamed protein product [Heligmosomoides polygyrus]|uniref:Uncharacterized protein n=1 Tax=Heligmosomoides polygyrus TaxID=6339 RepID=A0A183GAR1_HELPZ|nr:unnamed protein product [Heligmosomoides polygyrus]